MPGETEEKSQSSSGPARHEGRSVEFVNQIVSQDEPNPKTESTPLTNGKHDEIKTKTPTNFYIYFSHFLTKWGERMWTFAVGLYMIYISPDSLQLTAVYGLSNCAVVLLLGPVIGDWVDNVQRLRAARVSLILQTLFVVLSSAVIYCFLTWRDYILSFGEWAKYGAYAVIIIMVAASLLASTANTITVEKDWVVQMCAYDPDKLATMTARMKSIDLTTQILAPVATGQIMTFLGPQVAAICIAGWNVVTVLLEYYLIWKVYTTIPALRTYKDVSKSVSARSKAQKNGGCLAGCRMFSSITTIWKGWKTYASYECFVSGLALACLFMTVLGFDAVTVGYAKIQGLSESLLGILMGVAGLTGIIGTLAYPVFSRKLGLPRGGLLAMLILVSILSMCVVSLWLPGSPFELYPDRWEPPNSTMNANSHSGAWVDTSIPLASIMVLMAGIVLARFGLWISDLSISQMFMVTVKEEERGIVFGVQNSINQLMNLIKFGMVTALPLPSEFGYLVIISFSSIALGNLMYIIFFCRLPKNLFSKSRDKTSYTKI